MELQQSLAEVDDGSTVEQRAHLMECPACSALVEELDLIIVAAGQLQEADEPSPRVWNGIVTALRDEGIIRPQRPVPISSFGARWGAAWWLVPAAAMLLLSLGIYLHREYAPAPSLVQTAATLPVVSNNGLDDEDLMQEVASSTPAMKAQYEYNLRQVNQSIREAQGVVDESPNDEDARRSLMDAYHQKAMLFEMAMDHPQ
jgi:hypothetical protein